MAVKKYYYVGVQTENGMRMITKTEGKTALWTKNEQPKLFGKYEAEDIAYGLCLNFQPAVVVESIFEIDKQYFENTENEEIES